MPPCSDISAEKVTGLEIAPQEPHHRSLRGVRFAVVARSSPSENWHNSPIQAEMSHSRLRCSNAKCSLKNRNEIWHTLVETERVAAPLA